MDFAKGPLAQVAEHRTFNPGVAGSNPARPTIFKNADDTSILDTFCQALNILNLNITKKFELIVHGQPSYLHSYLSLPCRRHEAEGSVFMAVMP